MGEALWLVQTTWLFLALVYALALIIAGLTTLDPVTGYMGLEEEVREMAKAYLPSSTSPCQ